MAGLSQGKDVARRRLHLFTTTHARCLVLVGIAACGLHCRETPTSPFDGSRAYRDLEALVAMGPRVPGTEASRQAQAYIRRELEQAGLTVHEHAFQAKTPKGARAMANLYGVVEGNEPGVILLSTHYDTKYMPDIQFVGANDGGSTTAWLIEMARVLGPEREGKTVWLVFYDGEEAFVEWTEDDSLYGSRAFVEHLRDKDLLETVEAAVNVDMIGDCELGVFKDAGALKWLEDAVWETAHELEHDDLFLPRPLSLEDDHVPLRDAGVPSMNLIDFHYGGGVNAHRQNWHTSRDTIDKVCAESLKVVGDVIWHALPKIERALDSQDG
ncbi:MAG: M28 family peptidase [Candidatus Hydrogenedentales bacterium]